MIGVIEMIGRALWRLAATAAVVAVLVAAAPVSAVAAGAAMTAWQFGWPPRRLYGAALWCLPAVAVWLAASAAVARGPPGTGWRTRRTTPG